MMRIYQKINPFSGHFFFERSSKLEDVFKEYQDYFP